MQAENTCFSQQMLKEFLRFEEETIEIPTSIAYQTTPFPQIQRCFYLLEKEHVTFLHQYSQPIVVSYLHLLQKEGYFMTNIDISTMPPFDDEALKYFYVPEDEVFPSPCSARPLPKPKTKPATIATRCVCFADLIQPAICEVHNKIKLAQERGGILGIPSHLPRLNSSIGGYQEGLHIIAGAPGVGKTAFLLQTAINAAKAGHRIVMASFELSLSKLVVQAMCQRNYLIPKTFLNGSATQEEFNTFQQCGNELLFEDWIYNLHFIEGLHDTTLTEVTEICKEAQQLAGGQPILVIIDYLQKWARGQQLHQEIRQNVSILGGLLRELAKELKSPVIAVSNQNRSGTGKAEMNSLKESGDLEYDSDTITFLTEDPDNIDTDKINRNVKLSLTKNRFGELIDIKINYRADLGIMTDSYGAAKQELSSTRKHR